MEDKSLPSWSTSAHQLSAVTRMSTVPRILLHKIKVPSTKVYSSKEGCLLEAIYKALRVRGLELVLRFGHWEKGSICGHVAVNAGFLLVGLDLYCCMVVLFSIGRELSIAD